MNAAESLGHSGRVIENQTVSRFSPLMTMWLRNTPSGVKPNRVAAFFDGTFRLSHFHSNRR